MRHLLLGKAYLDDGDVGPAEVEFNEALRLGVNRAEVVVPLASIYLLQGRPGKLVESIPPEALPPGVRLEVLTLRGTAFAALDKRDEAERSFTDARAIDPASPVPLVREVPMLIAAGRMDLARERAARAVQLGPTFAGAYNVRGSVAHASGDIAAALKDYERAIELQPGFVDARVARCRHLIDLGRDAEARTDLDELAKGGRSSRACPTCKRCSPAAAVMRRRRRHRRRRVSCAADGWLAGHERCAMVGALAHHAGRQYEKARKCLDTLVARYPRDIGARKLLASIYVDMADHARCSNRCCACSRTIRRRCICSGGFTWRRSATRIERTARTNRPGRRRRVQAALGLKPPRAGTTCRRRLRICRRLRSGAG